MIQHQKPYHQQLYIFLMSVIGYVATYVFNCFLTRHMLPNNYGAISASISLLTILGTLSLIGTDTTSKKYLAQYLFDNETSHTHHFLHWSSRLMIKNSLFLIIIDLLLIASIFTVEHFTNYYDPRIYITFFFILFSPFSACILLISAYFSSLQRNTLATFIENSALNVFLLGIACLFLINPVYTFGIKPAFVFYGISYLVLSIITVIICHYFYQKKKVALFKYWNQTIPNKLRSSWLKSSLKIALFNMTTVIIIQSDILIIFTSSFFIHDYKHSHQTALFAVANVISQAMWLIVSNSYNAVSPLTSSHFKDPEKCRSLNRVILKSTITGVPLTIAMFLIIICFGHVFLNHFGSQFTSAYTTLIILCVSPLVYMLLGYSSNGLKYTGHEDSALKISIYSLIIFYIICPILTIRYGMIGTAISDVIIWLIIGVASNVTLQRKTNIRSWGC